MIASGEEVLTQQEKFKKTWKDFRPFQIDGQAREKILQHIRDLVRAQNGQDTDDYFLGQPSKLERYLPNLPKGSRILMLGTGCGREVQNALENGYDAYGTTLGSRNVEFATDVLGLPSDRVVECLNEALPFPPNFFDAVVGFQVFEHAYAPMMFLLEQRRVLTNNGLLFLEWPPAENYTMGDNPHHFICYTPGQAKSLFEKAGFGNIELGFDHGAKKNALPDDKLWDGSGRFDIKVGEETQNIEAHLYISGTKHQCGHWTNY